MYLCLNFRCMKISFSKYQGTGNDFIMIDDLNGHVSYLDGETIQRLCDRKFGIGADGLIRIGKSEDYAFEMDYYNSDGSKSFCGNGARCSVAFAETLGIDVSNVEFLAIDGIHKAKKSGGIVSLDMNPVNAIIKVNADFVLDTGSPHYVRISAKDDMPDVVDFGRSVRYSDEFKEKGINVNLLEVISINKIAVQTYERGVEDETLSCGTGVTACGLVYGLLKGVVGFNKVDVSTKGGELSVEFIRNEDDSFTDIKLIGPAEFVFKGTIDV
jgi:diaminopimelate epimerase